MKEANIFRTRSPRVELIDLPSASSIERNKNVKELELLGRYTGANYFALKEIKNIVTKSTGEVHLVDLGCGGGESLRYFAKWARKRSVKMSFTGVDNNHESINHLCEYSKDFTEIKGILTDYKTFLSTSNSRIDIIYCSLFCHHLSNDAIIELMKMAKVRNSILLINDLRRSRLPYYGSILITRLLNGSSLSRHDGPVSVLRGFISSELHEMATAAGYNEVKVKSVPFFRIMMVLNPFA